MFDIQIRRHIDPALELIASAVYKTGIRANHITWFGFVCGLAACLALTQSEYIWALIGLIANRLCDGVDGAVARAGGEDGTLYGGFLDIVLDMIIYAGFPLSFAIGSGSSDDMQAAAVLLMAYVGTASAFLALSSLRMKKGDDQDDKKSLIFGRAIAEGTETALVMGLFCLVPEYFSVIAYGYAVLCVLTTVQRVLQARKLLA